MILLFQIYNYMIFLKWDLYILTLSLEKVGDTRLFSKYDTISLLCLLYTSSIYHSKRTKEY